MEGKSQYESFNPFTLLPVEPKFFAGRKPEMNRLDSIFGGLNPNRSTHIFIEGARAIGKSSILKKIEDRYSFESDDPRFQSQKILFITVKVGDCNKENEACIKILNSFNKHIRDTSKLIEKLKLLKGLSFSVLGTGFSIDIDQGNISSIESSFSKALIEILNSIQDEYKYVALMIDETDKVVKTKNFGSLIKNTIEELDLKKVHNLLFIITTTPNGRKCCEKSHDGFIRAFHLTKLSKFSDTDSKELIERALKNGRPKTKFTNDAKDILIKAGQGVPGMLQELGYWAFEMFNGQTVTQTELFKSMMGDDKNRGSVMIIGEKHFPDLLEMEKYHDDYKKIISI